MLLAGLLVLGLGCTGTAGAATAATATQVNLSDSTATSTADAVTATTTTTATVSDATSDAVTATTPPDPAPTTAGAPVADPADATSAVQSATTITTTKADDKTTKATTTSKTTNTTGNANTPTGADKGPGATGTTDKGPGTAGGDTKQTGLPAATPGTEQKAGTGDGANSTGATPTPQTAPGPPASALPIAPAPPAQLAPVISSPPPVPAQKLAAHRGSLRSAPLGLQAQTLPMTMVLFAGRPPVLVASAPRPLFAMPEVARLTPGSPPLGATTHARAPRPTATPTTAKTAPSGKGGDERRPGSPVGPPGSTFFGAGTTAPGGGAASALWCAILVGGLVYAARAMRRYRPRFVMCEPVGFDFPQQRPG
jgi:hypothetical protein